jgi:phage virion morphogenesis protein
MAGARIEIVVDDAEVKASLKRLAEKTSDFGPAMKDIGEYLVRSTDERFDAQHDPSGAPWAPLAPSTLARKKGSKILIETSRLRDSIHYQAGEDEVQVGTDVVYGAIHQFGGKAAAEIPARPFLGISDADRLEILDIIEDHITGKRA